MPRDLTIAFVRSMPLNLDSRSTKMVEEYKARGHNVHAIIWTRGAQSELSLCGGDEFQAVAGYGRRWANLWVRLRWLIFIGIRLYRLRGSIDIVHTVDLDTAIITLPISKILGIPVIYDAYDQLSSFFPKGLLTPWLSALERKVLARADLIVFPDPIRLLQYGIKQNSRIVFIGNIPENLTCAAPRVLQKQEDKKIIKDSVISIAYVGTLEAIHRGLEFIPTICSRFPNSIIFNVAGVGKLADFFQIHSIKLNNLNYLGQLNYNKALQVMSEADCLYGPYLLTSPAHRFAVPNKMYEHLMLGRALITNTGTPVSELVRTANSGILFDGSYQDLEKLFSDSLHQKIRDRSKNAALAWQNDYSRLRQKQICDFFISFQSII